jgi:hypothetical protein
VPPAMDTITQSQRLSRSQTRRERCVSR